MMRLIFTELLKKLLFLCVQLIFRNLSCVSQDLSYEIYLTNFFEFFECTVVTF